MKVVLDTSVLVSGLLTAEGPCGRILAMTFGRLLRLCVDDRILQEYDAVLPRPQFQLDDEDVLATIALVRESAEFITPLPLPVELPDAKDMPFLEVAAAAEALLVTGNIRHFPKAARAGVQVLTPREFLDLLRKLS